MKLFVAKFYQTLILNVATIAAIVAGTLQFLVRTYKENNGPEKIRKVTIRGLFFINTLTSKVYASLNHELPQAVETVTVPKVSVDAPADVESVVSYESSEET
jgi:hypothetical protein